MTTTNDILDTRTTASPATRRIRVKSTLRAGGWGTNHSETQTGLRLKSKVRAGGWGVNHNETRARVVHTNA